ncbi:MAG: hypothetical protein U9O98_04490 [Asgard group archaeon]|nr:hypothetical protein [Asgard group archaeon]
MIFKTLKQKEHIRKITCIVNSLILLFFVSFFFPNIYFCPNLPTKGCISTTEYELNILWNETYGGEFNEEGKSLIPCSNGGFVIAGSTNSSGAGNYDVLLLKITHEGSELWNFTIGDTGEDKGYQIIPCVAGGYAVVSTYKNTTAIIENNDLLVTRITSNGTIIWNHCFIGPEQNETHFVSDAGRSIVECPNGDLVISGVTNTNSGGNDLWLLRINSSGQKIWERTYHHRDVDRCYQPHSLLHCSNGGFAIVGYTHNTTHSNDIWLVRTDNFGVPLWNRTYGDPTNFDRPTGLVECLDKGFAIIGNTKSIGAGGKDGWLLRTNAFGALLWNKTLGGSEEDGVSYLLSHGDGFTVIGSTHSFDRGNGDAWIIRLAMNKSVVWNVTIGDSYGNNANAAVYLGNNTYLFTGSTLSKDAPFSQLWVSKIEIITNILQTPTSESTQANSLPVLLFAISAMLLFLLQKKEKIKE